MELKFYDGFGDELIISEDENQNIVLITIVDDSDDVIPHSSTIILDRDDSLKLGNFLIEKFSIT